MTVIFPSAKAASPLPCGVSAGDFCTDECPFARGTLDIQSSFQEFHPFLHSHQAHVPITLEQVDLRRVETCSIIAYLQRNQVGGGVQRYVNPALSLIHISEPTRPY